MNTAVRSLIYCALLLMVIGLDLHAALIVHYKFDETSGTTVADSSGNNHGTVVTKTTANRKSWPQWSTLGKIDGAIHFFENGNVNVPAAAFASLTDQVSVCFWTYGDEYALESPSSIVDSEDAAGWRVIRVEMPKDGQVVFYAPKTTKFQNIAKDVTDSELKGAWHHWAFVKNSTTGVMKIYLDGTEWKSGTGKTQVLADVVKFVIGSKANNINYYSGLVDDFRVYDHMLSEADIQKLASVYTVTFQAAVNGRIDGEATQKVTGGENAALVTAVPQAGYAFSGWTGDHTGTDNPLQIPNVGGDLTITANFVAGAQPTLKTLYGVLDEAHVYSQALSADDVFNLYLRGTPYNQYPDAAQIYKNQTAYDLDQETYDVSLIWSASAHRDLNFRAYHYHTQAVTYNGYTYVVYADPNRYPMVAKIKEDGTTSQVANLDPDYGQMRNDGHHTIAIGVDKEGYLHVSGDMHNYSIYDSGDHMPVNYQTGHCNYWRSDNSEDISSFTWLGDQQTKSPQGRGFTYMGFFNDMYGELYYFSRLAAGGNYRVFGMSRYDTSTGDWSSLGATTLDDPYLKLIFEDNDEVSTGYSKIQSSAAFDRKNRLHMVANILNSETGPDFDPNFVSSHYSTDIVYLRSDDGQTDFKKANGSSVPLPARVESGSNQGDVVITWNPATFAFATHASVAFDLSNNPIALADTKTGGGGDETVVMAWDATNGWVNRGDLGRTEDILHQVFTDPAGVVNMLVNNNSKLIRFWDPQGAIKEVNWATYGELKGYDREYVKLTGNIQGIIQIPNDPDDPDDDEIGLLRIVVNRPDITLPSLPASKASWLLEETDVNDPVADSSGNGYAGERLGDHQQSQLTADGQEGRSLTFDGSNDSVWVSSLDWTPTAFSVAFWLKPTTLADYNQVIKAANGWGSFMFYASASGEVYVGTDEANRLGPSQLPGGTVVTGEWQHFVFTFASGTGRLYRNGSLLAEKSGMSAPQAWGGFLLGYADDPLLVTLEYFTVQSLSERVVLEWKTVSEIDTAGFHLWRGETGSGEYARITETLIPAEGGPTWGAEYEYEDLDVEPGRTYHYKLEDIDYAGVSVFHGPVSAWVDVVDVKAIGDPACRLKFAADTISGTPATSVDEDTAYSFTPTADAIDLGDTLTLTLITNLPGQVLTPAPVP